MRTSGIAVSRSSVVLLLALGFSPGCGGTSVPVDASDARNDALSDIARDAGPDIANDAVSDTTNDVVPDGPFDESPPRDVPEDQQFDALFDAGVDAQPDTAVDVRIDTGSADAALICSPGTGCTPFWCGCGVCDPAAITCVGTNPGCPLGCVSSCPQLATTTCSCSGGLCSIAASDAGAVDAGGGVGTPCPTGTECAAGLMCCYPCGIPGCTNQCMEPVGGHCPLIP